MEDVLKSSSGVPTMPFVTLPYSSTTIHTYVTELYTDIQEGEWSINMPKSTEATVKYT